MNRPGTSCRPPKSPSSRRPPKPDRTANTCRRLKEEDLSEEENTGGIAGDSSIAFSECYVDANHSTTGDGSTVVNPKRFSPRSDGSYYENESVMLWSDDPEKEYFNYMLQKEQENRARRGKSAEDSLIGDSTLGEIQKEFAKWHEHGGEVILMESDQGADDSSFPVAVASSQKCTLGRHTLDGFSLATEEKSSPKKIQVQLLPPVAPTPVASKENLFPNVIYVADTPETSVDMSKPSHASSRSARIRNCCIFSLFFLGGLSLASAAVVIYMAHSSKDSNFANTAASLQDGANHESSSPQGALRSTTTPSLSPSVLSQASTFTPTAAGSATETAMIPGLLPKPNPISMRDTVSPTANPTPLLRLPAAGGGSASEPTIGPAHKPFPAAPKASGIPTRNPTSKPIAKPTPRPTIKPTTNPTPNPTSNPTERPSEGLTEACGCKHCEAGIERMADGFTCKERINFLMLQRGYTEVGACRLVAGVEFPSVCGPFCDPDKCDETTGMPPSSSSEKLTPNYEPGQPLTGHNEEIVWRGQDGEPKSAYPLGHCEGDCNSDSDCAPGLVCFERKDSWAAVPGCFAVTQEGTEISVCMFQEHVAEVRNQVNGGDFLPALASKQHEVARASEQP